MSSLPQLDDPTDFHSPLLQQLDSSLRCQICHELFTAPVILTNCSHTFDSLCLRNHFKLSKKCPQCQVEANEDRIRRNLVVEEMVNNWVKARPDLLALQQTQFLSTSSSSHLASTLPSPAPIASTSRSPLPPPTSTSKPSSKRHLPSPRSKPHPTPLAPISLLEEDASSDVEVIDDPGVSSRKRPRREVADVNGKNGGGKEDRKGKGKERGGDKVKMEHTMGESTNGAGGDPTDPSILVSCPLCSKSVKNGLISSHIDSGCNKFLTSSFNSINTRSISRSNDSGVFGRMMGTTSGIEKSNGSNSEGLGFPEHDLTKYLALPNYAHKKLRDLESLLRVLNLPVTVPSQHSKTTASKIEYLKRRHSQYLTIWNSNVDLGEKDSRRVGPRELRGRLGEWEKVLDREERERERGKEKEKGGDKDYVKSHENDFKELIKQARESHEKNKNKTKESTEVTGNGGLGTTEERQGEGDGMVVLGKEPVREDQGEEPDSKPEELVEGVGVPMEGVESNVTGEGTENETENEAKQILDQPPSSNGRDPDQDSSPTAPTHTSPNLPTLPSPSLLASSPTLPIQPVLTSRKSVRILTPPPPPLSPLATPPPLHSEGRERRDRSSSILEYDEKFFPPQSQRVRGMDWESLRRGREEDREDEEEDQEEGE